MEILYTIQIISYILIISSCDVYIINILNSGFYKIEGVEEK